MKSIIESCKKILSNNELARKHNLPINYIEYEISLGIMVERLSVNNIDVAETFARKNIAENPHFYESLSDILND